MTRPRQQYVQLDGISDYDLVRKTTRNKALHIGTGPLSMLRVTGSVHSRRVYPPIVPTRVVRAGANTRTFLSRFACGSDSIEPEPNERWIVPNAADLSVCGTKVAFLTFRQCWFFRSEDNVESSQQEPPSERCAKPDAGHRGAHFQIAAKRFSVLTCVIGGVFRLFDTLKFCVLGTRNKKCLRVANRCAHGG